MAPGKRPASPADGDSPATTGRGTASAKTEARAAAARADTPDASVTRVAAEGNIELLDVRTLHDQLCDAFGRGAPIEIDLSSVRKIGTGGLQVLVAFVRDAQSQQVPYRWAGVSPTVVRAANEAGLAAHLDLPDPSPNREVT